MLRVRVYLIVEGNNVVLGKGQDKIVLRGIRR
jgi:hypothetical protein